jgi:hypothetical protein
VSKGEEGEGVNVKDKFCRARQRMNKKPLSIPIPMPQVRRQRMYQHHVDSHSRPGWPGRTRGPGSALAPTRSDPSTTTILHAARGARHTAPPTSTPMSTPRPRALSSYMPRRTPPVLCRSTRDAASRLSARLAALPASRSRIRADSPCSDRIGCCPRQACTSGVSCAGDAAREPWRWWTERCQRGDQEGV